jgi:hypothetical protein
MNTEQLANPYLLSLKHRKETPNPEEKMIWNTQAENVSITGTQSRTWMKNYVGVFSEVCPEQDTRIGLSRLHSSLQDQRQTKINNPSLLCFIIQMCHLKLWPSFGTKKEWSRWINTHWENPMFLTNSCSLHHLWVIKFSYWLGHCDSSPWLQKFPSRDK